MFDPITVGVLGALFFAFKKQGGTEFGVMTAPRAELYENAMQYIRDPDKLRAVAADFEKEGLKAQAFAMRKRAEWRGRSEETKAEHEKIFQKALASKNVAAILDVAKIFEGMTATVKAAQLRERARSLAEARAEPVETTAEAVKTVTEPAETKKTNGMSGHIPPEENGDIPANSAEA